MKTLYIYIYITRVAYEIEKRHFVGPTYSLRMLSVGMYTMHYSPQSAYWFDLVDI